MHTASRMRQYQRQAITSSTPVQLIAKIYDLGILACHRNDPSKVRAVLVELISALNFEAGGEIATNLQAIYEYCLNESANGNLDTVREMLTELRDAWRDGVVARQAA